MKAKTKKITIPSSPEKLRGTDPNGVLLFPGDPDMAFLHMEAGEVTELFEACKPKFTGVPSGKIVVFGTSGSAFGKAQSPSQEEVFNHFENIMIDGR